MITGSARKINYPGAVGIGSWMETYSRPHMVMNIDVKQEVWLDPCDALEKQLKKRVIVGVKESWAAGPMPILQ